VIVIGVITRSCRDDRVVAAVVIGSPSGYSIEIMHRVDVIEIDGLLNDCGTLVDA
jgi:hypothetical protein